MRKSKSNRYRGYRPPVYRGKDDVNPNSIVRRLPRILLILLIILILLGLYAVKLGQDMVYNSRGAHLERNSRNSSSYSDEYVTGLNVVEGVSIPFLTDSDAARLRAVPISIEDLIAGKAAQILEEQNANALIVEMKDTKGMIYWNTAFELIPTEETFPGSSKDRDDEEDEDEESVEEEIPTAVLVSDQSRAVEKAIAKCEADGIYLIARVHVLKDDNIGADRDYNMKTAGTDGDTPIKATYRDSAGCRWLDPTNKRIREMYTAYMQELIPLGFQEVLFADLYVPDDVEDTISSPTRVINKLCNSIVAAARGAESPHRLVRLGVETEKNVLTIGENTSTGQDYTAMRDYFDRIWCSGITEETASRFSEEDLAGGVFVLIDDAFEFGRFTSAQAILPD